MHSILQAKVSTCSAPAFGSARLPGAASCLLPCCAAAHQIEPTAWHAEAAQAGDQAQYPLEPYPAHALLRG